VKYQVKGLIRSAGRALEWFLGPFWEPFGSQARHPAPGGGAPREPPRQTGSERNGRRSNRRWPWFCTPWLSALVLRLVHAVPRVP
jgi:hypothetical protein